MNMRHLAAVVMLSAAMTAAVPAPVLAEEPQTGETAQTGELQMGQTGGTQTGQSDGSQTGQGDGSQTGQAGGSQTEQTGEVQAEQTEAEGQQEERRYSWLTMLSGAEKAQMLSVVIRSENGGVVVVDGGWEADGERLLETIKEYGGRVDAWLLTHPHADHVGALYYILRERKNEITIDNIYCSLAESEWYWKVSPQDAPLVDGLKEELSKLPEGVVHDPVGKDFETDVDNLHITVLNNRYQLSYDPVNNSSMVYMVDTGEKKILFLGDMGDVGGQFLLKEAGNRLKADIVQMAHHGQNGVDKEVYRTAAPDICLWPTPQWLWDNDSGDGYDSGPWRTLETRKWMDDLKIEQNYVLKDGDIILQVE